MAGPGRDRRGGGTAAFDSQAALIHRPNLAVACEVSLHFAPSRLSRRGLLSSSVPDCKLTNQRHDHPRRPRTTCFSSPRRLGQSSGEVPWTRRAPLARLKSSRSHTLLHCLQMVPLPRACSPGTTRNPSPNPQPCQELGVRAFRVRKNAAPLKQLGLP